MERNLNARGINRSRPEWIAPVSFFIEVSLFFLCLEAISVNVYSCSSRIRFVLLFAEAILIVGTF